MVVQHNMQAMNANRMLNVTTGAQSKSTEKLSSGYKINRAADDAAGLSISEKMRKQIRGLDQASSNAQDGVSAVQTAEGALTEVHSMLQRMNELAVQASNGTNSESDRQSIQDEIDQLTTEIDRVAETTKFNETYLLKGAADGSTRTNTINAHDAGLKGNLKGVGTGEATFTMDALKTGDKVTIAGKEYTIGSTGVEAQDGVEYTAGGETKTRAEYAKGTAGATSKVAIELTFDNDPASKAEADAQNAIAEYLKDNGIKITTTNSGSDVAFKVGALGDTGYSIDATGKITKTGDTAQVAKLKGTGGTANATDETVKIGAQTTAAEYSMAASTIEEGKTVYDEKGNELDGAGVTAELVAGRSVYAEAPTMTDAKDKAGATNSDGVDDNNTSLITATKAYQLIQNELKAASDIGADKGSLSTVSAVDTATTTGKAIFTITEGTAKVADKLSFNLHVGADADMTNKIGVDIDSMSAAGLGVKGLNVKDDTGVAATYAIDAIADAVAKVSAQRSALGAVQNRLEHTIANVDNVVENSTSAESRIRDTDMAEEMVNYSKNNILAQAGQSMLAQANQSNQGVLSLLG